MHPELIVIVKLSISVSLEKKYGTLCFCHVIVDKPPVVVLFTELPSTDIPKLVPQVMVLPVPNV
ncbi:MAG: hypothetical protein HY958_10630 [Bacteroidia bacterium]|nr:hypothetical protein [Bacteroidia bacterium]